MNWSSPPEPPMRDRGDDHLLHLDLEIRHGASPPALRQVSVTLSNCWPLQHEQQQVRRRRVDLLGDADRSWTLALPAPPPVPTCIVPDWLTPQLQARTSICSSSPSSCDSPSSRRALDLEEALDCHDPALTSLVASANAAARARRLIGAHSSSTAASRRAAGSPSGPRAGSAAADRSGRCSSRDCPRPPRPRPRPRAAASAP